MSAKIELTDNERKLLTISLRASVDVIKNELQRKRENPLTFAERQRLVALRSQYFEILCKLEGVL